MSQTVLITGCSSGIGQATARYFAKRGWNVAATVRNLAVLESVSTPLNVAAFELDVTTEHTIATAVDATTRRFGSIDVVVNNAGYGLFGPLEGATAEQFEEQFRTNVFGVAAVLRHVLPVMRKQRSGTVVNMSSIGGRVASPLASAYYSTKFAIEGLSESLRFELKPHGIRVKLVEPGHFKTNFLTRSLDRARHPAYDSQWKNMHAWMLREDEDAPDPAHVAEAVYQCATDPSDRLRYPVKGAHMLLLRALLPDAIWRKFMGAGLTRHPDDGFFRRAGRNRSAAS